jgi:hypothetical protein
MTHYSGIYSHQAETPLIFLYVLPGLLITQLIFTQGFPIFYSTEPKEINKQLFDETTNIRSRSSVLAHPSGGSLDPKGHSDREF